MEGNYLSSDKNIVNMQNEANDFHGIFDTHAHYEAEQFDDDRELLLSKTLPNAGVTGVLNVGSDLDACYKTLELTQSYDYFYGAVGIHPENARELPDDWLDSIKGLLSQDKIVAVGEIGLDYHWLDDCPKPRQKEVFEIQMELANDISLPVVLHDREAHGDMMEYLKKYRPRGVMHCFSGSLEMAREVVALDMYIGLGGVLTFKNARHAVDVAREIPLSHLLLETDAPYMAPVPFRGKRNDSSLIRYVAQRIAELKGISVQEVIKTTRENTQKLFDI